MASTVKIKDVVWRISVLLGDSDPQFSRYTEQELVMWLDDAQMALAKYLPEACTRMDAIKLRTGAYQSIDTIAASSCKLEANGQNPSGSVFGIQPLYPVCNMGSNGTTQGAVIRQVSRKMLDLIDPLWQTRTGAVVEEFMFDPQAPKVFHVYPSPPAGTDVWIKLAYTAQPEKIANTGTPGSPKYHYASASNDVLSVSDDYQQDCVNYVVARANMKDTDWSDGNKAMVFAKLWADSINGKVQALTGSNPNIKRLPFAPEPLAAAS